MCLIRVRVKLCRSGVDLRMAAVESVSAVLLLPTALSMRLVSAPMGSCPKFLDREQTNEQSAKTQKQNVAKQNEPITMQTT